MINRVFYCLCLLSLITPLSLHSQVKKATNWKVFDTYEGQFRIEVPGGEMDRKEKVIHTELGEIAYVTYVHQTPLKESENALYIVSYCDYPANSMHSDSLELLEDFFSNTIEKASESVFGEVRYEDDIRYIDYPGKLFRIDYRQGTATLKSKVFIVNNRFYNIQIATTKGKSLNNAADHFLDSFFLLSEDLSIFSEESKN